MKNLHPGDEADCAGALSDLALSPLCLAFLFVFSCSLSHCPPSLYQFRLGFADAEEDATLDGGWLLKATTKERVAALVVFAHGVV